jgi:hypothetical protein
MIILRHYKDVSSLLHLLYENHTCNSDTTLLSASVGIFQYIVNLQTLILLQIRVTGRILELQEMVKGRNRKNVPN